MKLGPTQGLNKDPSAARGLVEEVGEADVVGECPEKSRRILRER